MRLETRRPVDLGTQSQELREIEQQLAESRASYAELYHQVPVAHVTLDREGVILEANAKAIAMLGRPAKRLVGRPLFAITRTEGSRALVDHLDHCRRTTQPLSSEMTLRLADGRAIVQLTSVPVATRQGWVTGFRTTFIDITPLRRAEAATAAACAVAERARQRAAFLTDVGATLAVNDCDGVTAPRMARLAVPRFASWCVIEAASVDDCRRELAVAYDETTSDEIRAALDRLEESAADLSPDGVVSFSAAWPLLGNDSVCRQPQMAEDSLLGRVLEELAPRSYLSVPIAAGGRIFGRMLLGADVPRERYEEADLKIAEELGRLIGLSHAHARLYRDLRRAVTARDELLAFVSHDLRNSMAAVRLQTRQLRSCVAGDSIGDLGHGLDAMGGCLDGALRFIGEVIDLGRIEAGMLAMHVSLELLAELAAEAMAVVKPAALLRGVRIELTGAPGLCVRCDRSRTVQVLINLLDNAVKFSPPGGRVRVSVEATASRLTVRVRDEGPGVPDNERQRLFTRGPKAARGERTHEGLGLGLFISKCIVDAHGGQIWIDPAAEPGASFAFTLPL